MRGKDKRIQLLKQVPLFWGCSETELRKIASIADLVQIEQGEVLMKEGDIGRDLLVIAEGRARITRKGRKVRDAGPGDAIGELALLDQGPRSATVTAETPLTAYVIGARSFTSFLRDAPSVTLKLLRSMAGRLRTAETKALH